MCVICIRLSTASLPKRDISSGSSISFPPQGHVFVQGIGYYPPQGYPHPIGMRYPSQSYHLPQYDAPPHGHGQGYPPQKQKQNQATISVMGGWYALHLQSPYIIHHCLSL